MSADRLDAGSEMAPKVQQLQRRNDPVIGANVRPIPRNCAHLAFRKALSR